MLFRGEHNLELSLHEYSEGSVVMLDAHSIVMLCYC